MWPQEFQLTWHQAGVVPLSALVIYAILIFYSRMVGPRSFAQMTAFDFAVTVAVGAIIGATATRSAPLPNGVVGLSMLFLLRWLVALGRQHGLNLVDNQPLLLMVGPEMLPEYLERAKITESDLLQSLRSAGISQLDQVRVVIMERNGSINVLKSDGPLDPNILKDVAGYQRFLSTRPPPSG